jgi:hypothetical protein
MAVARRLQLATARFGTIRCPPGGDPAMESVSFAIVAVAVVALIAWRGVALYNATFHRKDR